MPRIIINPDVFHDKRDALAVAFNEGLRVFMETRDFEPEAEPTEEQRKFFSDTPYADDETMLRRTILARIATFDTSVKDPTADQIAETAQVLRMVLESDFTKTPEERAAVKRLFDAAQATLEKIGGRPLAPKEEEHGEEEHGEEERGEHEGEPGVQADAKGGNTAPILDPMRPVSDEERNRPDSRRPDGTYKERGYLGRIDLGNGDVATEYSAGFSDIVKGKEIDIPTIVPGLTSDELGDLKKAIVNRTALPKSVITKAVAHARQRIHDGKSVYWNPKDDTDPYVPLVRGNLHDEHGERPMVFFRNEKNQVTGYGTTYSTVVPEDNGWFTVIPTIYDGRINDRASAIEHYRKTGDNWGTYGSEAAARYAAESVHLVGQKAHQREWNKWLRETYRKSPEQLADGLRDFVREDIKEYPDDMPEQPADGSLLLRTADVKPEAPTADAILSAYGRRAAMKGGDTAPSAKLVTFLKKHEKYAAKAYKDVGGYAVGYGAHTVNGKAVTEGTTLSAADADAQLARDIGVREQRLSGMLPGWGHFDRDMKDAVIQAAFGNDDMFTVGKSPNLHRKLTEAAALKDPTARIRGLADALYDELPTYTRANGEVQPGLEARQLDARDTFLAGTGRRRAAEEATKQAALDKKPLNEV